MEKTPPLRNNFQLHSVPLTHLRRSEINAADNEKKGENVQGISFTPYTGKYPH